MASRLFNGTPMAPIKLGALVLLAVLAGYVQEAAAANIYRYVNDRGVKVYGSSVPPEFVKNGYEVINERGLVVQVVPRAPTEAELAAQAADRERQAAEAEVARVQREADNLLLRLYRSPDEIARKRDERLTLIEGQLIALTAALTKARDEAARLQQIVDNNTKAGREAPAATLENLLVQQSELERLTTQQARLEAERASAVADTERDMKRLSELLGLPKDSEAE